MSTYENNQQDEYYIASEVAEILALDKNTILNRCKKGFYPGAMKADPRPDNPHGVWLIPKRLIDTPTMTQEVVTLTRQITANELERAIAVAISQAVSAATEPLRDEIRELTAKISHLEIATYNTSQSISKKFDNIIEESRADHKAIETNKHRPWWNFWG